MIAMQMNNRQQSGRWQQQGLSLVELMVAIALGLFLSYGAVQAFLSGKKAYTTQEAMSRIQETGRLAQEFLNFDIRRAGDYGCGSGDAFAAAKADDVTTTCATNTGYNLLNSVANTDNRYNFSYPVWGINNFTAGTLSTVLTNPVPVPGTDVLVVHVSRDVGVLTVAQPAGALGTLTLNTTGGIDTATGKNIIAISDCANLRIVQVSAVSSTTVTVGGATPGNRCTATTAAFDVGSQVKLLDTYYYYIGVNATTNRKSLYRRVLSQLQAGTPTVQADELLEGVEDMQISFGLDTDGDNVANGSWAWEPNSTTAITNAAWNAWDVGHCTNGTVVNGVALSNCLTSPWPTSYTTVVNTDQEQLRAIRSVRYKLLIASADPVLDSEQQYSYNGATQYGGKGTAGTGDKRLRGVFTSTVAIRSMQQTQ